ncbi:MAG TPA: flagellar basal body rod protein FlgC [Tepidisphaeraceae bacterium]|jgi:flagellar basal-body rod protein FlgC|nr:flagellar basal body rod protein FlgC [Tepidisphaeraceae bacterium]
MFDILDMGASGLTAQRVRLDTIAGNIANINTERDADGKPNPYRRRFVVLAPGEAGNPKLPGVHVQSVQKDMSPLPKRFDPGNPDADKNGYVSYPNVDLAVEFVNALEASRAYEANVTMMDTAKSMFNSSLRLLA